MEQYTPCTLTLSLFSGQVCVKCGIWKVFSEFVPHKTSGNATSKCLECDQAPAKRKEARQQAREERKEAQKIEAQERHKTILFLNPNYFKEKQRAYRKANPQVRRKSEYKRRCLEKAGGPMFKQAEWELLCKMFDYRCLMCGKVKPLTVDHIHALSNGGDNCIENVQPLCHSCNSKKRTKEIDFRKLRLKYGWDTPNKI